MSKSLFFRTTQRTFGSRTVSNVTSNQQSSSSAELNVDPLESALPFEDIPEPKSLPIIGTFLDYTPLRGFHLTRMSELWKKRHQEYGDIYKEKFGSTYGVFCRSKEDTERMFRMEGRMPFRIHLKSMETVKTLMGHPDSIVNARGETWLRMRQPLNKILMRKPGVWKYVEEQREVCKDGVRYILEHRNEKMEVPDFAEFLRTWAFEMSGTFVMNCRLGLLNGTAPTEVRQGLQGAKVMMDYLSTEMIMSVGKLKQRIGLKRALLRSKDFMLSIIEEQKKTDSYSGTFLQEILELESLSDLEKESLLFDIVIAAVETTSNTMALCLYCLATNSHVQDKLRNEIMSLTPEQRTSGRAIDSMKYMNGLFKETHRLLPFVHALPRCFDHDVVLSGYRIPAGTLILNSINSTFNKNPSYFESPDDCIPERWMEKNTSKFRTSGPFGIGARACPGRFFARQEIYLFLTEILSRFEVQYKYEPASSAMRGTGALSKEPRFSFIPIN